MSFLLFLIKFLLLIRKQIEGPFGLRNPDKIPIIFQEFNWISMFGSLHGTFHECHIPMFHGSNMGM